MVVILYKGCSGARRRLYFIHSSSKRQTFLVLETIDGIRLLHFEVGMKIHSDCVDAAPWNSNPSFCLSLIVRWYHMEKFEGLLCQWYACESQFPQLHNGNDPVSAVLFLRMENPKNKSYA